MPHRYVGQLVSGLDGEFFENVHRHLDPLRDAQTLVGLQTESPCGVFQTVLHSEFQVALQLGTIHRLQPKMSKVQVLKSDRVQFVLRIYKLEFIAGG